MSLHVVQLGPVPPPEGGISRNIQAIREELGARGHRCSIVATSRSSRSVPEADVYHPATAFKLIRQVRALKPDVLHLHIGGDLTTRVLALTLAATFLTKQTVLTVHSGAYPLTCAAKRASARAAHAYIFH